MNLKYRGVSYQANSTTVKINQRNHQTNLLKYRGCDYQLNHSHINLPQSSDENMVYRGISVTTGNKIHFLGGTYNQTLVIFQPITA